MKGWILLAIDAVINDKSLKLTNYCIVISGAGLEPLRGSVELERIDLSLVGDHEHPTINPEPPISVSAVVTILDSITGTEGNSLFIYNFPKKWREERSNLLTQFADLIGSIVSWGCEQVCESSNVQWGEEGWERSLFGMNTITCYSMHESFCHSCEAIDGFIYCEKFYCEACISARVTIAPPHLITKIHPLRHLTL